MDTIRDIFGLDESAAAGAGAAAAGASARETGVGGVSARENRSVEVNTPMSSLASFVMARFKENEDFRRTSGKSANLDYCLRANRCVFDGEQREVLKKMFGGNQDVVDRMFVPITSVKNRAAKSMMIDLINQSGEPLFHIEPTPDPTVPQEVADSVVVEKQAELMKFFRMLDQSGVKSLPADAMAEIQRLIRISTEASYDEIENRENTYAMERAKRMERRVFDILEEGGFNAAFADYIDNLCVYGTGVIIGPVVRKVAKNTCRKDKNGVRRYRREVKSIPTYESVNPQDVYPAPDAKDVGDGALCIVVKYTADELNRFANSETRKGVEVADGWFVNATREMLSHHPRGGVRLSVRDFDYERRFCEFNGFTDVNDCTFEGVRCFSSVRGSELLGMGITKSGDRKAVDAAAYYNTETIVIDNRVVYCKIYDDLSEIPVSRGCFYTLPGSWWGDSIADKVKSCQMMLNNCLKSMLVNMTNASGPVWWVNDVQRLVDKSPGALKMKSGKTIAFMQSLVGNQGVPIGAINVPSNASELLAVWQKMQDQADIDSGVPRFSEGQNAWAGGALRTAQGLAISTEASTRQFKMVMTTTDKMVLSRVARLTVDWVMLNEDDMSLKGDVTVRSVGLMGRLLKTQRDQQRLQLFNMVLQSQVLQNLIGVKGLLALFRPSVTDIDVNPDEVLPSKEKMEQAETISNLKQVFEATQAADGVNHNVGGDNASGGGAVPGVSQPPKVQGGVAERRGAA